MVTYSDLFQYTLVITAIITLVIMWFKKNRPATTQAVFLKMNFARG